MRDLKSRATARRAILAMLGVLVGCATGSDNATGSRASFQAAGTGRPFTVSGQLNLPKDADSKVPAVVIVHGSAGIDGRGSYYARALNGAGIATFEIDMWAARGLSGGPTGRPQKLQDTLPDAYGALLFLAQHPAIDPSRIGITGYSWGGGVTLHASSVWNTLQFTGDKARFAGHLAFYPTCYAFRRDQGLRTGSPIHILVGDRDNYEGPTTCSDIADRFKAGLTVYPGATHAWDTQRGTVNFYDSAANEGRGGPVAVVPDSALAEKSRAFTVEFFRKVFAM